jgi:hypothetical protein
MKVFRGALTLTLAIAVAGCAWRRTPVPIISDTGSTGLLVGTWAGEYSSTQTGRSGSISFELASEKDTAYCDVVMVPSIQSLRIANNAGTEGPAVRSLPAAEPLKLRFIRLGEGRVTGTLEPYKDPDCSCMVTTTFEGRFSAPNTIEGRYVTTGVEFRQETGGRWKVTRQNNTSATP